MKSALLTIDMLNHFEHEDRSKDYHDRFLRITQNINFCSTMMRAASCKCIHVGSQYTSVENYYEFPISRFYPPHAIKGSPGALFTPTLDIKENDSIVYKTSYNAFFETNLLKILKSNEVTRLFFTGVSTHVCILFSLAEAYYRNFECIVLSDCVTSIALERHSYALQFIERHFGKKSTSLELISQIQVD